MSDSATRNHIENINSIEELEQYIKYSDPQEQSLEHIFEKEFQKEELLNHDEYGQLKIRGLRDHFQHKKYWSWLLMFAIGFMVIFQFILVILVGVNALDFRDYTWLLPTLMVQYLAQIVGLAVFVVRSLFKDIN